MRIEDIELTYFEIIPETYRNIYPIIKWKLKEIRTVDMVNYEFVFEEAKNVESQLV